MLVELGGKKIELDVQADLTLNDAAIDADMCALPQKIGHYAELMGQTHTHALNMKHEMEVAEAVADQHIRAIARAEAIKITEPAIKGQVSQRDEVREARSAYYAAEGQHKTVEGAYRALRDTASLAIAICYKQKAEIQAIGGPLN